MKRITTIIVAICAVLSVAAQTATDKVQQREKGKGSVTVTQSSAINDLVNNKGGQQQQNKSTTSAASGNSSQQTVPPSNGSGSNSTTSDGGNAVAQPSETDVYYDGDVIEGEDTESSGSSKPRTTTVKKKINPDEDLDAEKLKVRDDYDFDAAKKVKGPKIFRGEHKARGWRILVFTGGNKRIDRQGAQAAGKKVKDMYPGMPVFTHFYTPRWMTFCGNFHDHKEAESVKKELMKKGFKSACIVRTQIIVE